MGAHLPTRIVALAALLALLLSLAAPVPAWADEPAPPPGDPAAPATDPDSAAAVDPAAVPDDSGDAAALPAESPPTAEPEGEAPDAAPGPDAALASPQEEAAAAPDEASVAAGNDPPDEAPALPELLTDLPDGTTLAIVDTQGEPVPLVSNEAEAILASGDPIWCPASVKSPAWDASDIGLNGCHDRKASLQEVFAELAGNQPTVDGIIWIQGGVDSSASLVLNGSTLATMSLYRLTLRGGWDGGNGSKIIDSHSPSIFNVPLGINNWQNDITLSDIEITGASAAQVLQIQTTKNLSLTRVNVHDNTGTGAYLDTQSGGGTGNVSLSASQFNANTSSGLRVFSGGAITLANILASDNGSTGAYLTNESAGVTAGVTLTGANTFEDNGNLGLEVRSRGAITANDLTASRNGSEGVHLENRNGVASPASPGVRLTGTNIFTDNSWSGLIILSNGAIALNNLYANANTNEGVYAFNQANVAAMPITLTGTSQLKYNGSIGLRLAARGKITVNNVTASGNLNAGADLSNTCVGCASDVVLTGSSAFHDNTGAGLDVSTYGAIQAANLAADRNGSYGADLDNDAAAAKSVTLTGINAFHDNAAINLMVSSKGAINVSNLTASGSQTASGAVLANYTAASAQKVTLSGTNVFEDNAISGLQIESKGAISVSNPRALRNGLASGNGIYLYNASAAPPQPVTLTGSALASDNYNAGLWIESNGNLVIANLTASGNQHAWGAYLKNDSGTGSVTLTGTNVFNDNYNAGLSVSSAGVVKISNLTASRTTHGGGAGISNISAGSDTPRDVTLSGTHLFEDNYSSGLVVNSYGAITLSSASAIRNGIASGDGAGISLSNAGGSIAKPLTLSGTYGLIGNDDFGLSASSLGAIKVNNLTASENGSTGASLYNAGAPATVGITLTGASAFLANGGNGLEVASTGAITAANLTATGNAGVYGVDLDNRFGSANVTLTGVNVFSENSRGLHVYSRGAVALSNVTASGNVTSWGAGIFNNVDAASPASPGVTLSGTNVFNDNDSAGLGITTYGTITLSSVTACRNDEAGVSLQNGGAAVPKAVKLTGAGIFNDNAYSGLYAVSKGAISAASLSASGNGQSGVWLENNIIDGVGGVTLTGTNVFGDNSGNGLHVTTYGAISLNSVTAGGNGNDGAYLHNDLAAMPQPVKLSGTNAFSDNGGGGLEVETLGAITVNSLSASGNTGGDGASLISYQSGAITLTGVNAFNDNAWRGLYAYGIGAIALNSVTANGNGLDGVYLQNTSSTSGDSVKFTGTNTFRDNTGNGLVVQTDGAITANNLSAWGNGIIGAGLYNATGTAGVSLTGTNAFSGNTATGLDINSLGAVSLTRVTADDNGSRGISITGPAASVTITCGSVTGNTTYGIFADAFGLLKLIGVVASGNGTDLDPGASSWTIVRACPLN